MEKSLIEDFKKSRYAALPKQDQRLVDLFVDEEIEFIQTEDNMNGRRPSRITSANLDAERDRLRELFSAPSELERLRLNGIPFDRTAELMGWNS